MGRFIVIVLDGLGIGEMQDVPEVRPEDKGANTLKHIIKQNPDIKIPNLTKLGILNVLEKNHHQENMTYGCAKLTHFGADTFFGHQEIMGTKPTKPFGAPLSDKIDTIQNALLQSGYAVARRKVVNKEYLIVENAIAIADNIECDPGQAINITVSLDLIEFDKAVEIAKIVRGIVKVPRVIVFGGRGVSLQDITDAQEEYGDYVGVNAPKSGVYKKDYHCVHMGYGVDEQVQVQTILGKKGIPVFFLGKVADVVQNTYGKSFSIVPTAEVLEKTKEIILQTDHAFICANVQETDLSGHMEDSNRYAKILETADIKIGEIIDVMAQQDVLIVMADHGNDPTIGHPHHTREVVPILIKQNVDMGYIGIRETLSDVAATVSKYFGVDKPENGTPIF